MGADFTSFFLNPSVNFLKGERFHDVLALFGISLKVEREWKEFHASCTSVNFLENIEDWFNLAFSTSVA